MPQGTWNDRNPPVNKWLITITVMLPTIMEIVDTSVANVALPHMQGSLNAGTDEITWVLTSYLVANAVVLPMTGWLSRMFGRKRFLITCIVLFTLASFCCGAAPNLGFLVFFRVLQGAAGGALIPNSQAILMETFPPKEQGMAMAIFGIGAMFGPIIGPALGGYVTDQLNWRWIFYINFPIGVIAVIMAAAFLFDPPYLRNKQKISIDYWGLALLVLGFGALQIVLDKGQQDDWFDSGFIVAFAIVAAVSLLLLVVVELRHRPPHRQPAPLQVRLLRGRQLSDVHLRFLPLQLDHADPALSADADGLRCDHGRHGPGAGRGGDPVHHALRRRRPLPGRAGALHRPVRAAHRRDLDVHHARLHPGGLLLRLRLAAHGPGPRAGDDLRAADHHHPFGHPQAGDGQRHRHVQPAAQHRRQRRHRRLGDPAGSASTSSTRTSWSPTPTR